MFFKQEYMNGDIRIILPSDYIDETKIKIFKKAMEKRFGIKMEKVTVYTSESIMDTGTETTDLVGRMCFLATKKDFKMFIKRLKKIKKEFGIKKLNVVYVPKYRHESYWI